LPDFIIIGGMKCESTALYQYLVQHPDVLACATKEVHFFDNRFERGVDWYRQFFPLKIQKGGRITGEASPYYIFHPAVPARIKQLLPEVKLIAVLRNPVDRAFSHYQHAKRKGFENLSFADAIAREEERLEGEYERLMQDPAYKSSVYPAFSYKARGLYWQQLERFYQYFDRDQLLVLRSEDMFDEPQSVVDRVLDFLQLPPFKLQDVAPKNKGSYERKWTPTHEQLAAFFAPHNELLYAMTGVRFW